MRSSIYNSLVRAWKPGCTPTAGKSCSCCDNSPVCGKAGVHIQSVWTPQNGCSEGPGNTNSLLSGWPDSTSNRAYLNSQRCHFKPPKLDQMLQWMPNHFAATEDDEVNPGKWLISNYHMCVSPETWPEIPGNCKRTINAYLSFIWLKLQD